MTATEPDTQSEQDQHIDTLTAAIAELTQRIAELEAEPEVVDILLPNRMLERGTVQRIRRGDGRVVQRVTRPR